MCLLVLAAGATGCSTQAKWTYPFEPIQTVNDVAPDVRIAVLPAKDSRPTGNHPGTWFLYMIPVMPLGWATYERPEAAQMFMSIASYDSSPYEDIPKAIAQHLKESRYAKTVFFDYGGLAETADYVLQTELRTARYDGKIFSYGLSVYGPLLWIFGLPAGASDVTLALEFVLLDKAGEVVWRESVEETGGYVQGLYYNMGQDMEWLPRCVQRGLDRALRAHPLPAR